MGFGGATLTPKPAPTASLEPTFHLAGFGGDIRVTWGKLAGGTATILERDEKRFIQTTDLHLPKPGLKLWLVKAETLKTDLVKAPHIDFGVARKGGLFPVSKDIDAWLYRTVALVDAKGTPSPPPNCGATKSAPASDISLDQTQQLKKGNENMNRITNLALALSLVASAAAVQGTMHDTMKMGTDSSVFKGVDVNKGTVMYYEKDGKRMLSFSKGFIIPKSPAPQWQVVDTEGNAYLLNQLRIAGDKTNLTVTLPAYVKNVAKVRIWCSFAEVNLGEASFATPVGAK
ncbi:hypothetical protein BH11ARM2_BH11ARM2_03820 [soil metagenome]